MNIEQIRVAAIRENPKNRALDEATVDGIAASVAEVGLIQPIEVTPAGDGEYMVVDGHHRFAAVRKAGLDSVPAIVRKVDADDQIIRSVVANIHRKAMTYSEQVKAMQALREAHGDDLDVREVARKLGVRPATAAEMVFVAELPEAMVAKGDKDAGYRALLHRYARLSPENREVVRKGIEALVAKTGEYPSREQFERAITRLTLSLEHAPFDTDECIRCPFNTNAQQGLFADPGEAEAGCCTKSSCYMDKVADEIKRVQQREVERHGIKGFVTHFVGEKNPRKEAVTLDREGEQVEVRPWNGSDFDLTTAEGCEACEKRCLVTQARPGAIVPIVVCADSKCYEGLMRKPEPVAQTAAPVGASGAAANAAPTKGAAKPAKAETKIEFAESTATIDHRVETLRKYVLKCLDELDMTGKARAVTLAMAVFGGKSEEWFPFKDEAEKALLGAKHFAEADEQAVRVGRAVESADDAINRILVVTRAAIMRAREDVLRIFYSVFGNEAEYRAFWTHKDEEFLKRLTRAQMLGLLDEAGLSGDEAFFKEAKKAKKGDLVKIVLDADLGGHVPDNQIPKAIVAE